MDGGTDFSLLKTKEDEHALTVLKKRRYFLQYNL